MIHAASGRNSAVSSRIACGSRPEQQQAGRDVQEAGDAGERVPEHVGLRAQREGGGEHDEADRDAPAVFVDPARDAVVVLGLQRQRAAGDEARDAGHRVQGEHEQVAARGC